MKNLLITGIVAVVFAACQPHDNPATGQNQSPQESEDALSQDYLMAATLFVQQAAEYRALCYQAYATATLRLQQLMADSVLNPAVILDIDETVLDNSAYSAWQVMSDKPYSTETWAKWTDLAVAREVPGAGEFLRFADSLGVTLFYVSNRDTSTLDPTIKNMRELDIPQLDREQFMLRTNTSGKEDRRQAVKDLGYNVVMLIGDNLGDFHEKWDKQENNKRGNINTIDRTKFGVEYIVLPNPIYGTWEGEIYQFNREWSDAQRDSLRRDALVPAPLGS